ncbi:transposase [Streptomyces mirabilis]|uniref:transposase n=1 Tax=Streptomyces mirabilis TaxID=68239 RepID=UPI00332ACEE5
MGGWDPRRWRPCSESWPGRWPRTGWTVPSGAGSGWPQSTGSTWTRRTPRRTGPRSAGRWPQDGSPLAFPQVRVVTLTEIGTHAVLDARVGGLVDSEQDLAAPLAVAAAGMLVIMDRGFVGVGVWRAFTGAGAHVLIRAKTNNARTPIAHLPDGTYLAEISQWTGGRKSHTVTVRVIEYQVDGGETVRLLTDLLDPDQAPAAELAALYHERWEAELSNR